MTNEFMSEVSLCQYLQQRYNRIYRPADALPLPFYIDRRRVRAIVLGTDPSNPRGVFVQRVFGLENPDSPYFRAILDNLNQIALSLEEVYVENLCKNYFRIVTTANPNWGEIAALWRGLLQRELDALFDRRVPVLLTAWPLYSVLASNPVPDKPSDLYRNKVLLPPTENHLGRTIAPFFRHWYYGMQRWGEYCEWIKSLV
jgi:hypothetical protein